ncbi:sushi, von Willebrand factor type A, EGF and pentraxin domain-containing protein 1-like isoform X2 [Halichondria panicea]|uniref:sushi, von Willebrand factor type A, EGF and pentraxin domain-containing protein 1-like isoform X2 n=1 Tax=Halichondria panicea TaxID=6063 RepID=UPI00312B8093
MGDGRSTVGVWTGTIPICAGDIDECAGPNNCTQVCINTEGSFICGCEAGYVLYSDGASCSAITCSALPLIENGVIVYSSNTTEPYDYGTTSVYECNTGYEVTSGDSERTCTESTLTLEGIWNGTIPTCSAISCGSPPIMMNANIGGPTPDTTYQGKVTYICVSGYWISNGDTTATATCMANKTWGPLPTCSLVDCGYPLTVSILNGSPGAPSRTTYQGTVIYTCVSGYEVSTRVTTAMATCTASGTWGPLPICQPVDCGSPTTIRNGSPGISTPGTTLGGKVTYTCVSGYEVSTGVTTAMATCMANRMWETLPTCSPVSCGDPPSGNNASPGIPTNTLYQGAVTYTCVTGYWISQGSFSGFASCMADRTWGPLPTCSLVDCGSPSTIGNASPGKPTNTTYLRTVTYTCDSGYEVSTGVTTATATCMSSGMWETVPTCQCVTCGDPPSGTNASPETPNPDTLYQGAVTYTCYHGYEVSNGVTTATTTCMANKTWGPLPTCQLVDCGSPTTIVNASPGTPNRTTYQGIVTYTCVSGYEVSDEVTTATATCMASGMWEPLPTCQRVTCSDPPSGNNASPGTTNPNTLYQETVTYTCETGYWISPGVTTAMATCMTNGIWEPLPTCTIVDCGAPPTILNGTPGSLTRTTFGETVSYTCIDKYHISGSATVTCEASGSWSTRPTCSAICKDLNQIVNGDIIFNPDTTPRAEGTTAVYSCVSGYQLSGVNTTTCVDGTSGMGGEWTESIPSCRVCDSLTLTDGVISYSPSTTPRLEGGVAIHSCDEGYGLSPSVRTRTCQPDKTWSGEDVICQTITCPPLTHPHGSVLHFSPGPLYPFGTQARYLMISCPGGMEERGVNDLRTCTGDGHSTMGVWNGTAPVCAGQPLFLSLQGVSYSTNKSNILVTRIGTTNDSALICHTNSTTCCRDRDNPQGGSGEWLFPNGTMITENSVTGSRFYWIRYHQVVKLYREGDLQFPLGTYCCRIPDGHGDVVTVCANLTANTIRCPSDSVMAPTNGTVSYSSPVENDSYVYGTVATFSCSPGFSLDSPSTRTCETEQGTFSGTTPSCIEPTASGSVMVVGIVATIVILVVALLIIGTVMVIFVRVRRSGKHTFSGLKSGGGRVTRKSLFTVKVDPLTRLDIPLDNHIDTLTPDANTYVGVTTSFSKEGGGDNTQGSALGTNSSFYTTDFPAHVDTMHEDTDKLFEAEYTSISKEPHSPNNESKLPHNTTKNRFGNVFPYDFNRVKLKPVKDIRGSDYINASYVNGYMTNTKYIAAQGPLPNTLEDFWKMIMENKLRTIVMLTKCFEERKKCECYWPLKDDQPLEMGCGIVVSLTSMVAFPDFTVRRMKVNQPILGSFAVFEVTLFHYTSWPDHGVPSSGMSLIYFTRAVRKTHPQDDPCPLLVHCSAGVGRTGTFIVLDTMLDRMEQDGMIHIYDCVTHIRKQRVLLVQTLSQYIFLHDALKELIVCGETEIPAHVLMTTVNQLKEPAAADEERDMAQSWVEEDTPTGFQRQFKILSECSGLDGTEDYYSSQNEENEDKNRYSQILPNEMHRVQLQFSPSGSNYINASYIHGYQQRRGYIATQGPLEHTTGDLWRMVVENECSCIVMLCTLREEEQEVCHRYWPKFQGEAGTYGDFTVTQQTFDAYGNYVVRKLSVAMAASNEPPSVVTQFHFTRWTEKDPPQSPAAVLDIVQEVNAVQMASGNKPIVVMCNNGIGRTGVFITLHAQLERLKIEGVVDVFQFIKFARKQREGLVSSPEMYAFCHEALADYVDSFETYANFKELV